MTREKIIHRLYRGDSRAIKEAIKTLEQESIIDKLRDEIMDTGAYEQEVNGNTEFLKGISYCLGVIDKYKAESESEEWKKQMIT